MSDCYTAFAVIYRNKIIELIDSLFSEPSLQFNFGMLNLNDIKKSLYEIQEFNAFRFPSNVDQIGEFYNDCMQIGVFTGKVDEEFPSPELCSGVHLRIDEYRQKYFDLPDEFCVLEFDFCNSCTPNHNPKPEQTFVSIIKHLKPFFAFSISEWGMKNSKHPNFPWLSSHDYYIFDGKDSFWKSLIDNLNHQRDNLFSWDIIDGNINFLKGSIGIGNSVHDETRDVLKLQSLHMDSVSLAIKNSFSE